MNDEQPLTGDSSLSDVIAGFERETAPGRDVQAALSHVNAELGSMPLRRVRPRHVSALLDDLHDAGLSPRRETAVVDALGSLFAFARAHGLTEDDPLPGRRRREASQPASAPAPAPAPAVPSATLTMLTLGSRVASWTAVAIFLIFALLFLALILELA